MIIIDFHRKRKDCEKKTDSHAQRNREWMTSSSKELSIFSLSPKPTYGHGKMFFLISLLSSQVGTYCLKKIVRWINFSDTTAYSLRKMTELSKFSNKGNWLAGKRIQMEQFPLIRWQLEWDIFLFVLLFCALLFWKWKAKLFSQIWLTDDR